MDIRFGRSAKSRGVSSVPVYVDDVRIGEIFKDHTGSTDEWADVLADLYWYFSADDTRYTYLDWCGAHFISTLAEAKEFLIEQLRERSPTPSKELP